jgi:hypothetical protein
MRVEWRAVFLTRQSTFEFDGKSWDFVANINNLSFSKRIVLSAINVIGLQSDVFNCDVFL